MQAGVGSRRSSGRAALRFARDDGGALQDVEQDLFVVVAQFGEAAPAGAVGRAAGLLAIQLPQAYW